MYCYQHLCLTLLRNYRVDLGFILELIKYKRERSSDSGSSNCSDLLMVNEKLRTRVPSLESELARIYLGGPNSIPKNTPVPDVNIIPCHSYVTFK